MTRNELSPAGTTIHRENSLQGQRPLSVQTPEIRQLTNAELVQLQIRMIALENVVIALLSSATAQEREVAKDMAVHILPRAGFTQHRLTIHAAQQMRHLVDRASIFCNNEAPESIHTNKADG